MSVPLQARGGSPDETAAVERVAAALRLPNNLTNAAPSTATPITMTLANLAKKRDDQRDEAELLGRHAHHQRRQAVFGHVIGLGIEIGVALARFVLQRCEQRVRSALVLRQLGQPGHQVEAEVAFAAECVGVVVRPLRRIGGRAFFARRHRPHQAVRGSVVAGLLGPADDLDGWNAELDAFFIARVGAFAVALEQVVGVPFLGVVVLHIPRRLVAHGHEPAALALGKDHPLQAWILAGIAHRVEQRTGLRLRHEQVTGRQTQRRLPGDLDVGRALGGSRACVVGSLAKLLFGRVGMGDGGGQPQGRRGNAQDRRQHGPWSSRDVFVPSGIVGGKHEGRLSSPFPSPAVAVNC